MTCAIAMGSRAAPLLSAPQPITLSPKDIAAETVRGKKKQGTKPESFTEVTGFHVTSKLICNFSDLNLVVPPL